MSHQQLQAARITLTSIDPAGLASAPPPEDADGNLLDDPFGATLGFDNMVVATGGHALHGRNDIHAMVDTSVREEPAFYTVSYAPSPDNTSNKPYRNIRIVLRNPDCAPTPARAITPEPIVEPEPYARRQAA